MRVVPVVMLSLLSLPAGMGHAATPQQAKRPLPDGPIQITNRTTGLVLGGKNQVLEIFSTGVGPMLRCTDTDRFWNWRLDQEKGRRPRRPGPAVALVPAG